MEHFTKHLARFMVAGALAAALILAVAHGAEKGSAWYLKLALIIGLVCVAIGEFLSWHNAATAWHERRAGSLVLWGVLGGILSAGTLYTNFSSAASNNDSNAVVQQTAFVSRTNVVDELKAAKAERSRLEEELRMKPTRTPEAAQAAIDNAKAHRFWGVTKECTETKGPQTRGFCDAYASAVAEKSMGTNAIAVAEELKAVKARIAKYEADVTAGKAVVSADAPQIGIIKTRFETDDSTARQIDAMVLPMLVQAMLLFGGILLANEAFRGRAPRPWINWRKMYAGASSLFSEPAPPASRHAGAVSAPASNVGIAAKAMATPSYELKDRGRVIDLIGAAPA